MRVLRLRRRRSGVPGVFLIYHAGREDTAGVGAGAAGDAAPDPFRDWEGDVARESGFALAPEERGDVQR